MQFDVWCHSTTASLPEFYCMIDHLQLHTTSYIIFLPRTNLIILEQHNQIQGSNIM